MQEAIKISILNLAVFVLMSEGYVFHQVNIFLSNLTDRIFGLKLAAYIQNPLFNCYVCMSSVWTIIWGFELTWHMPIKMLLVCGISYSIEKILVNERDT